MTKGFPKLTSPLIQPSEVMQLPFNGQETTTLVFLSIPVIKLGGFIRFAWAPTAQSDSAAAFDAGYTINN